MDQPDKIEFTDTMFQTIKVVDIWKTGLTRIFKMQSLLFGILIMRGMGTIPYSEQKVRYRRMNIACLHECMQKVITWWSITSFDPSKYQNFGMEGYSSNVVGVKHTLHIYDLSGNFKYELKDLPSVDQAVVSNDGRYMMYIFGGMGLANANNPFGTIDRSGWALMRLKDQKGCFSNLRMTGY
ncbi:MAG: hypothetical protein IPL63_16825 [Saprospiraceae bacterium]|nr:hypothetical protein [Saprospiraceae bacterium]